MQRVSRSELLTFLMNKTHWLVTPLIGPKNQLGQTCGWYAASKITNFFSEILKTPAYHARRRDVKDKESVITSLRILGKKAGIKGIGGIWNVSDYKKIFDDTEYQAEVFPFTDQVDMHNQLIGFLERNIPVIFPVDMTLSSIVSQNGRHAHYIVLMGYYLDTDKNYHYIFSSYEHYYTVSESDLFASCDNLKQYPKTKFYKAKKEKSDKTKGEEWSKCASNTDNKPDTNLIYHDMEAVDLSGLNKKFVVIKPKIFDETFFYNQALLIAVKQKLSILPLLKQGATATLKDSDGKSAIDYLIAQSNWEALQFIAMYHHSDFSGNDKNKLIEVICFYNKASILKILIDRKIVTSKDNLKEHIQDALSRNYYGIAALLISLCQDATLKQQYQKELLAPLATEQVKMVRAKLETAGIKCIDDNVLLILTSNPHTVAFIEKYVNSQFASALTPDKIFELLMHVDTAYDCKSLVSAIKILRQYFSMQDIVKSFLFDNIQYDFDIIFNTLSVLPHTILLQFVTHHQQSITELSQLKSVLECLSPADIEIFIKSKIALIKSASDLYELEDVFTCFQIRAILQELKDCVHSWQDLRAAARIVEEKDRFTLIQKYLHLIQDPDELHYVLVTLPRNERLKLINLKINCFDCEPQKKSSYDFSISNISGDLQKTDVIPFLTNFIKKYPNFADIKNYLEFAQKYLNIDNIHLLFAALKGKITNTDHLKKLVDYLPEDCREIASKHYESSLISQAGNKPTLFKNDILFESTTVVNESKQLGNAPN